MGNVFKISLFSYIIPVLISIIGYFIVPNQIISRFNQETYDNKVWIFLLPAILFIVGVIFSYFVIRDRKSKSLIAQ